LINQENLRFYANEWSRCSLGRINRKSIHSKSNIAIVLDDIVYSAPGVSSGLFLVVDLRFQGL
jgi:hypothetical protein